MIKIINLIDVLLLDFIRFICNVQVDAGKSRVKDMPMVCL